MKALAEVAASPLPRFARDHVQGPSDAPLALVEYGDFECPYCAEAYPVVRAVQKELGEQLCFAFRHFPLTTMHEHAQCAAEAAEAAGAQGAFWSMHDLLFENQHALDDAHLSSYAAQLGLNPVLFSGELLAGTHRARVREDVWTGARVGVKGTPAFFVNGTPYPGPPRMSELLRALIAGHQR